MKYLITPTVLFVIFHPRSLRAFTTKLHNHPNPFVTLQNNKLTTLYQKPEQYTGPISSLKAAVKTTPAPKSILVNFALATALTLSPLVATPQTVIAYDSADDTIAAIIKRLEVTAGKPQESLKAFEEVATIITEGKGVGGDVSYGGVDLNRAEVTGEDTTIYNPGLTLLTESEKNSILKSIMNNRKIAQNAASWSEDNEYAFQFLKQKLDPLHMAELKGYLGIFPFYAGLVYLAALGVQQIAREFFTAGYIFGALLVFGPVVVLLLFGA
eukprot:CAMPEP_0172497010 /NCGR_PEP_ID=MMETSP1066-20121228/94748_1 /TAXON_ID=671091 /ORGANISM="Coscinodiscus wailesii, Strain CCMP2513" /LENGTH=268 /DNA_ID=CAMNT_0013269583 /DNA_START=144 /DNA_END=950 /DNA_ORIENTATION=-